MEGRYRATCWGNINTGEKLWWGLWFTPKGKRNGMPVCYNGKPMFYDTEKEAKKKAKELNAEMKKESAPCA